METSVVYGEGDNPPNAWNLMKCVQSSSNEAFTTSKTMLVYFVFLYFDPIYSWNKILTLYRQRFWIDHSDCDKQTDKPKKFSDPLHNSHMPYTCFKENIFLLCGCLQVLWNFGIIENIYWQISVTSSANFSDVQGFNLANFLSKKLQNTIGCNTSSFTVLWFLQHSDESDPLFFLYYWTWISYCVLKDEPSNSNKLRCANMI